MCLKILKKGYNDCIMKTFNAVLSTILRVGLIFLLYFIWLRYFLHSLLWAVAIAITLTLTTDFLMQHIIKKKSVKKNLKKEELARAEGYANHFVFSDKKESLAFYFDLLSKNFQPVKRSDFIAFAKGEESCILYPFYKFNTLSVEDVILIFNKVKNTKADEILLCVNLVDENVKKIISKLPIKFVVLDKYETYEKLMKKFDTFPNSLFNFETNPKMTFKGFLAYSLNRKKAGGYIFASFILLISSLFVKVTVYYLIMSSILLVLSIFSYTNTIFNKKLPENVL